MIARDRHWLRQADKEAEDKTPVDNENNKCAPVVHTPNAGDKIL
jgi:hypothetical protein